MLYTHRCRRPCGDDSSRYRCNGTAMHDNSILCCSILLYNSLPQHRRERASPLCMMFLLLCLEIKIEEFQLTVAVAEYLSSQWHTAWAWASQQPSQRIFSLLLDDDVDFFMLPIRRQLVRLFQSSQSNLWWHLLLSEPSEEVVSFTFIVLSVAFVVVVVGSGWRGQDLPKFKIRLNWEWPTHFAISQSGIISHVPSLLCRIVHVGISILDTVWPWYWLSNFPLHASFAANIFPTTLQTKKPPWTKTRCW